MGKKILVISAHPDDEVLGCGGTIARLAMDRYEVYTLLLGEGVTSRYNTNREPEVKKELEQLRKDALSANKLLGVKGVIFAGLPDNRFDHLELLDIVKFIEKVVKEIKPDIVLTHYEKDLNIDHQITYKAVITATRPLKGETVKEIYSFEIPSSTEWFYPLSFSPNVFYDISETIDVKLRALEEYKTEIREYPHPRSLGGVKLISKCWGMKVGLKYAEAFKLIRSIR